jgi:hypothetical protein
MQSTKGQVGNKGMKLYQDHVMGTTAGDADDGAYDDDVKRPLSDVTKAIKSEHHNKDFAAHWEINDNSPAASKNGPPKNPVDDHAATKSNWSLYQNSPETRAGINIAGNGMGGRKTNEAAFSLFEDSPVRKENNDMSNKQSTSGAKHFEGDGMGGKKSDSLAAKKEPGSTGINIAGNGMGSRKTNEAAFSLFEDSPVKKENNAISNRQNKSAQRSMEGDGMGGKKGADNFWDF